MPAADAIRLIRRINALARTTQKATKFSPTPIYGVAEGPSFVSDEYGLPRQLPNQPQPLHIIRRRNFLKSLSPLQRNLLLTGDPVFAFDPVAYELIFQGQLAPPELQQEFDYLTSSGSASSATSSTSSSQPTPATPSPASSAAGTPPATPPAQPRLPAPLPGAPRKANKDDDAVPPPQPCDDAGSSPVFDVLSPASDERWMRSSQASTTPYVNAASSSGWNLFKQKTKEFANDLLDVPPPGWQPPGQTKKASTLRRTMKQLKEELTNPPPPWFEKEPPPAARQRPTGSKPKTNR